MIVADTSIWIEFMKKNKNVFPQMREFLEHRNVLAPECVFGELLQGAKNQREREVISAYWEHLPKLPERGIWIEAGLYSGINKFPAKGIGLIDVVILLIARKSHSQLWTLDRKLLKILEREETYVPT